MSIAQDLLSRGQLQKQFDLPDDTTVGGMLHAIVRKPTISFGQADRDYMLDTTPSRAGHARVSPATRRFTQESPALKTTSTLPPVVPWREDYIHLKADRVAEPLVDLSFTSGTALLDKQWVSQYRARLAAINKWRIAEIEPHEYPWPTEVHGSGTLDTYAPFVLRPVSEWPDIVMQEGFVIVDRDAIQEPTNAQ
jgi:hypothetical protein